MPAYDLAHEEKEQQWVQRIQEGDRAAFEQLFHVYYHDLCGFVQAHIHAPDVAEDLVQDLFLDFWRRRGTLHVRSSLKAYLFGAARNLALSHLEHRQVSRRWERQKRQGKAPTEVGPDEQLWERELARALQACVAELPERRQMVYRLSRQHGLTYREIAAIMEISPRTVENQMVHALKFLRERLLAYRSVQA